MASSVIPSVEPPPVLYKVEYTYFIVDDLGTVKIGRSYSPRQRLRQLATAHKKPLRLVAWLRGAENERALHRRFAGNHIGHEWFFLTEEIESEIWSVKRGGF